MRVRWPDRTILLPLVNAVQRKSGYPSQRDSTRAAKAVYMFGGWLWSTFRWTRGIAIAMRAESIDPVHFPHWAEDPLAANGVQCPVCGGRTESSPDGWYAVARMDR